MNRRESKLYEALKNYTPTEILVMDIETYCDKMDFLAYVAKDYRENPDE